MNEYHIHYYLKDGSHTLDAFVRNKCEARFLSTAMELAKSLNIDLKIEANASSEGGFLDRWNAIGDDAKLLALATITAAFLTQCDYRLDSEEQYKDLVNENLYLQNEKLRLELQSAFPNSFEIKNPHVKTKLLVNRSEFYKSLSKEDKIDSVGFTRIYDGNKISDEVLVSKKDFENFISISESIEDEEVFGARIEILSPVLKESDSKWKGIYDGKIIRFSMNDQSYKKSILSNDLAFKSDSEIKCILNIQRKIDEFGEVQVVGYSVDVVLETLESDGFKETRQGKMFKDAKKKKDSQQDLF